MLSIDLMPGAGRIDADAAAAAFAALGSAPRLAVLNRLVRAGEAGLAVGALQDALGMPASTLSHHLRALMQAELVSQERQGRSLICRACFGRITTIAAFLLRECCVDDGTQGTGELADAAER